MLRHISKPREVLQIIARDCRYGKLFCGIVNYRQFYECKPMRDFAVIAVIGVWANYCQHLASYFEFAAN